MGGVEAIAQIQHFFRNVGEKLKAVFIRIQPQKEQNSLTVGLINL